jgi:hypothetical protein
MFKKKSFPQQLFDFCENYEKIKQTELRLYSENMMLVQTISKVLQITKLFIVC